MGWYIHATVFVLVNLFVFACSEYAFGSRHWSIKPFLGWGLGLARGRPKNLIQILIKPFLGWGLGLALHGISVFWLGKTSAFRERLVEKERERLRRQNEQR